jgi:hypothetical protein
MTRLSPRTGASRTTYVGIFFLALSIILFQIALTRVFAIMMWHHLTYMVVSIALLGFGAAGSLLTARRDSLKKEAPDGALAAASIGYGLAVMGAFALVRLVRLDSLELWSDKTNLVLLLGVYLVVAVPFLLGGLAIGMALTRHVDEVNRLYFTDLVGSALGAAVSMTLLAWLGGSATVFVGATCGLLAAVCFSLGATAWHRWAAGVALAFGITACLVVTGAGSALGLPTLPMDAPFAPGKELADSQDDPELDRIFSGTAEVEVASSQKGSPILGGEYGLLRVDDIPNRWVGQDGTAPTMLYEDAGDLERFPFLTHSQTASAHIALEARGGAAPEVLVIGVGGGADVMVALAHGAKKVTAVELNTAMIEMVVQRYDDYLGGLFRPGAHLHSDRIELVNSEGRAYMRSRPDRYDIIQMSGVDSFTALNTGAYTLSESYLYTTEAVQEFYAHLNDGGYINYSRFILTHPKKPRETLRLAHIAYTALEQLGIEDPSAQIAVFQGAQWASTIIKRGPFSAQEIDALHAFADAEGFLGLVYDPVRPADPDTAATLSVADRVRALRLVFTNLVLAVHPDTTSLQLLAALDPLTEAWFESEAAAAGGDVASADEAPTGSSDDESSADTEPATGSQVTQFVDRLLAAGALDTARAMLDGLSRSRRDFAQLLHPSPDVRRTFVDGYPYDISPSTDDKPFFFNYYRYSQLFGEQPEALAKMDVSERYHPDFPVGHMVLLASMVQIVLLAAVLIFLPLRGLARDGLQATGTWRYFAYFTALGMGFMFIEMVLMQKVVIFLGHPTYAVSVVLAALLGSAGLGSFLAGRIQALSRTNLMKIALALVIVLAGVAAFLNYGLPPLLGASLSVRIAIVVVMILPLGLVLGMPFPTGMRIVETNAPQLLPWCWAINGFLSVFSSVLCIVLSMWLGFTFMFVVAAVVYAVGFWCMPAGGRLQAPSTS